MICIFFPPSLWFVFSLFFLFFAFWVLFCLFRATPAAYGGSQAKGQIGAVVAGLHHSHAGFLTHWARLGIEPVSSWILVRFVNHWAVTGPPYLFIYLFISSWLHPRHVEVPRPGIEPAPQQRPEPLRWQCWIVNPLCHKGTPILWLFFMVSLEAWKLLRFDELQFIHVFLYRQCFWYQI